jgi:hypothetical protein
MDAGAHKSCMGGTPCASDAPWWQDCRCAQDKGHVRGGDVTTKTADSKGAPELMGAAKAREAPAGLHSPPLVLLPNLRLQGADSLDTLQASGELILCTCDRSISQRSENGIDSYRFGAKGHARKPVAVVKLGASLQLGPWQLVQNEAVDGREHLRWAYQSGY